MKAILLLALCSFMLVPTTQYGQTKAINKFYKQYKVKNNSVSMSLPGWLIDVGADVAMLTTDLPAEKKMLMLLKDVQKLKILVLDGPTRIKDKHVNSLFSNLREEDFEDLVLVRDQETRVNIMIKEKDEFIRNLFLLIREPEETVMVLSLIHI